MKFISSLVIALFGFLNLSAQTPCNNGMAGDYPCQNMDLLVHLNLADIGSPANTNDIWGWVSPLTGAEYALVGCSNGTVFLRLTDPTDPEFVGFLPTHTINSLWRDLETFNNYVFIVSEATGHGLQIFDLMQLDAVNNGPVEFDETVFYGGFGHCHTLNIDVNTGFCYCMGTDTFEGGLHIVDINDPLNPELAGGFSADGYTHDGFAWLYDGPDNNFVGKELVFACNEDELTIVDVSDKSDCQAVGSYDYEGQAPVGYVHQGWITKDKSYFLVNDELDEINIGNEQLPYGTRTHIFDISSLENVDYVGYFENTPISVDHNLYVLDQFVYESNYRSGIRVMDAVHIADGQLSEVAYFDLYPNNDFAQFSGTWSNYPYLPSKINIATSMYDGVFITKPTLIQLSEDNWNLCSASNLIFEITINAELAFPLTLGLQGLPGANVASLEMTETSTYNVELTDLNALDPGTYYPDLLLMTTFGEEYVVPFKLTIATGVANAPILINVPDGSLISVSTPTTLFEWAEIPGVTSYEFQLATNADFTSIVETQVVNGPSYLMAFALPDADYFWRVRALNDCGTSNWSDVFDFQVLITGVDELAASQFSVYPNPAGDVLNIKSLNSIQDLTITDATGRIVLTQSVQNNSTHSIQVSLKGLSTGLYILKSGEMNVNFIKQ